VDDAVVMQIGGPCRDAAEPGFDFLLGKAVGIAVDDVLEAGPGDVFHHDPGFPLFVVTDVKEVDEIGVLEIQALADAPELDFEVPLNVLEGDFLAGIAGGEIDFAEATFADAPFDGVPLERARTTGELKLHGTTHASRRSLRHGNAAMTAPF